MTELGGGFDGDVGAEAETGAGDPGDGSGGRKRPALLGGAIAAAAVMLVCGVALATRDGGGEEAAPPTTEHRSSTPRPTASSTTTAAPSTVPPATETETTPPALQATPTEPPATTEPPPEPPAPPAVICDSAFDIPVRPLPTQPLPPGHVAAIGPPTPACEATADACVVSFTMNWTDGHVETTSQALSAVGFYTLNGDRGTTANFEVKDFGEGIRCDPSGSHW